MHKIPKMMDNYMENASLPWLNNGMDSVLNIQIITSLCASVSYGRTVRQLVKTFLLDNCKIFYIMKLKEF